MSKYDKFKSEMKGHADDLMDALAPVMSAIVLIDTVRSKALSDVDENRQAINALSGISSLLRSCIHKRLSNVWKWEI